MRTNHIYKHEKHGYVITLPGEIVGTTEYVSHLYCTARPDTKQIVIGVNSPINEEELKLTARLAVIHDKENDTHFIKANRMLSKTFTVFNPNLSYLANLEGDKFVISFHDETDVTMKLGEIIVIDGKNYVIETGCIINIDKFVILDSDNKLPRRRPTKDDKFKNINSLYTKEYAAHYGELVFNKNDSILRGRTLTKGNSIVSHDVEVRVDGVFSSVAIQYKKPITAIDVHPLTRPIDGIYLILYYFKIMNPEGVRVSSKYKKAPHGSVIYKMDAYI